MSLHFTTGAADETLAGDFVASAQWDEGQFKAFLAIVFSFLTAPKQVRDEMD